VPEAEPVVRAGRDTVVPLELFFDLVFVFAFTQVSTLLIGDPTWSGVLRASLLLSVLWWAWSAYAWLTNTPDPEEGGVRMAMLVASLAAPLAFGRDATTFAIAYLIVRVLHLVLSGCASVVDSDGGDRWRQSCCSRCCRSRHTFPPLARSAWSRQYASLSSRTRSYGTAKVGHSSEHDEAP
jgi:low temperature requirement protein LtrA